MWECCLLDKKTFKQGFFAVSRLEQISSGLFVTVVGGVLLFFILRPFDFETLTPNLINRTLESATSLLAEEGLEFSVEMIQGIQKEVVVSQHPLPGVALPKNQAMLLIVQSGIDTDSMKSIRNSGTIIEKRVLVPVGTKIRIALDGDRHILSDNYRASMTATLSNEIIKDGELIFAKGANVLVEVSTRSTFYKRTAVLRVFGIGSPSGQTHPVHTTDLEISSSASLGTITTAAVLGALVGGVLGLIIDGLTFFTSMGLFTVAGGVIGLIIGISTGSNSFSEQKAVHLTHGQLVAVSLIADHNLLILTQSKD